MRLCSLLAHIARGLPESAGEGHGGAQSCGGRGGGCSLLFVFGLRVGPHCETTNSSDYGFVLLICEGSCSIR